ncbi:MAG: SDR family NAD(P)-dependent oxidoreductase, partial [Planctomycetota bacterium]
MTERKELRVDLHGEVIVVTGGGGVLCSTMCKAVAAGGAAVAVLDISEAAARQVADDILAEGGQALAATCDVLQRDQLVGAAERIAAQLGTPTALINGAGGNSAEATTTPDRTFFDLPKEAVQWVFDLNFIGTILACQVFGKTMA